MVVLKVKTIFERFKAKLFRVVSSCLLPCFLRFEEIMLLCGQRFYFPKVGYFLDANVGQISHLLT